MLNMSHRPAVFFFPPGARRAGLHGGHRSHIARHAFSSKIMILSLQAPPPDPRFFLWKLRPQTLVFFSGSTLQDPDFFSGRSAPRHSCFFSGGPAPRHPCSFLWRIRPQTTVFLGLRHIFKLLVRFHNRVTLIRLIYILLISQTYL